MTNVSNDRRKHPRATAKNIAADLCVAGESSRCIIENISAGGVLILTDEVFPSGMPVAVGLSRPGWPRVLQLTGRVVATSAASRGASRQGMRIRFDAPTEEAKERLARLLADLEDKDSETRSSSKKKTVAPFSIPQDLTVRVGGLPPELNEMRLQIAERDREIAELRALLTAKTAELERSEKERSAAEQALQRLSLQLATRRR